MRKDSFRELRTEITNGEYDLIVLLIDRKIKKLFGGRICHCCRTVLH